MTLQQIHQVEVPYYIVIDWTGEDAGDQFVTIALGTDVNSAIRKAADEMFDLRGSQEKEADEDDAEDRARFIKDRVDEGVAFAEPVDALISFVISEAYWNLIGSPEAQRSFNIEAFRQVLAENRVRLTSDNTTAVKPTPEQAAVLAAAEGAKLFMQEMLDSVETFSDVDVVYGTGTVILLLYLHSAILNDRYIDLVESQRPVKQFLKTLPSSDRWLKYTQDIS